MMTPGKARSKIPTRFRLKLFSAQEKVAVEALLENQDRDEDVKELIGAHFEDRFGGLAQQSVSRHKREDDSDKEKLRGVGDAGLLVDLFAGGADKQRKGEEEYY